MATGTDELLARFARLRRRRWIRDHARMARREVPDYPYDDLAIQAIEHVRTAWLLLSEQLRRETKGRRRHRRLLHWGNRTICDMEYHHQHHADEQACREILTRFGDPPLRPSPRCCPEWRR